MDSTRFDHAVKQLGQQASRRSVLGGLAVLALAGVTSRAVEAAPSSNASCMKACVADAKTAREACAGGKSKAKNDCLKAVNSDSAACKAACKAARTAGSDGNQSGADDDTEDDQADDNTQDGDDQGENEDDGDNNNQDETTPGAKKPTRSSSNGRGRGRGRK